VVELLNFSRLKTQKIEKMGLWNAWNPLSEPYRNKKTPALGRGWVKGMSNIVR